jgi:signal peptide peptidase SppA
MRSLLLSWIASECWALDRAFAERAVQFLMYREGLVGEKPDDGHGFQAAAGGVASASAGGDVVVLPIHGVMAHRISQVNGASQPNGVSSEMIGMWFDAAVKNPDIGTIVLDINSPGGSVAGTKELADKIYAARSQKRVIAVANANAASAAYWIGSSAGEFYITPSGRVGSIGVFAMHQDISEKLSKEGIKPSFIYAGERKVLGNSAEPLGTEAREMIQQEVDAMYADFVNAISRNRAVERAVVERDFGRGGMLLAEQAFTAGAVDGILSLDDVLASLGNHSKGSPQKRNPRAAAQRSVGIARLKAQTGFTHQ